MSNNKDGSRMVQPERKTPVDGVSLKPCPFCGGLSEVIRHEFHQLSDTFGVHCLSCGAQSRQFYITAEQAADAWNARLNETKPMIPQIREFRERFEELHEGTPRYIFCNEKTFRELEIEAGVGYIKKPANKCPTAYGMVFVVPKDGEIIIGNGYVEKYKFEGGAGK